MTNDQATSSRRASTAGGDSSSGRRSATVGPRPATFPQLCAILETCLASARGNVTDAKDLAGLVLARRQLQADVATIDRAIAAVLTAGATERLALSMRGPGRTTLVEAASAMRRGFDRVDWRAVLETLKAHGIFPKGGPP